MKNSLKQACGIALIVAGAAGMVIPIVPGIPIIAAGVAMLGADHPLLRPCRKWLQSIGVSAK